MRLVSNHFTAENAEIAEKIQRPCAKKIVSFPYFTFYFSALSAFSAVKSHFKFHQ